MKKYRIALVTDKYLPIFGGLEIFLHDLAHELTLRGHEPHIVCVTPGHPDDEIFRVHRLDVPRIPQLYRARSRAAITELDRVLRTFRFDLIHAHCVFSPLAHAATWLARQHGIPSVLTVHSDLRGAGGAMALLVNRFFPWAAWPTVLSAVSNYVAADLRAVAGRDDVELILNAAHLDRWRVARAEESRIVSAMRFTIRKRPKQLVRMLASLHAVLPRALWPKLVLIGDGPEFPSVRREVARLGLQDHVELPGYLPQQQLAQQLARAAVFAVPSRREALSIAAIEARAAGVPVVARIPSGVAEVIDHGVHGLLARDDDELVSALARLLGDSALRARMSEAARQELGRFEWRQCLDRHEEVYAKASYSSRSSAASMARSARRTARA